MKHMRVVRKRNYDKMNLIDKLVEIIRENNVDAKLCTNQRILIFLFLKRRQRDLKYRIIK